MSTTDWRQHAVTTEVTQDCYHSDRNGRVSSTAHARSVAGKPRAIWSYNPIARLLTRRKMMAPKRKPTTLAVSSPSVHGKRVRGDLHSRTHPHARYRATPSGEWALQRVHRWRGAQLCLHTVRPISRVSVFKIGQGCDCPQASPEGEHSATLPMGSRDSSDASIARLRLARRPSSPAQTLSRRWRSAEQRPTAVLLASPSSISVFSLKKTGLSRSA